MIRSQIFRTQAQRRPMYHVFSLSEIIQLIPNSVYASEISMSISLKHVTAIYSCSLKLQESQLKSQFAAVAAVRSGRQSAFGGEDTMNKVLLPCKRTDPSGSCCFASLNVMAMEFNSLERHCSAPPWTQHRNTFLAVIGSRQLLKIYPV